MRFPYLRESRRASKLCSVHSHVAEFRCDSIPLVSSMALDRRSHAVLWGWKAKDKSWVLPQLLQKTRDTPKRPKLKWDSVFIGRTMIEMRTYIIASPTVSIVNDGTDTATASAENHQNARLEQ